MIGIFIIWINAGDILERNKTCSNEWRRRKKVLAGSCIIFDKKHFEDSEESYL